MKLSFPYCENLYQYKRFPTREVKVGSIGIGGNNPIRLQSMTTTDTMNTMATVEESIRMIQAGCELVRITAPSIKDANNLQNIKDELRKRGYNTPLVADIHFTPNAALAAAEIVEKVRVNPGNYADKKKFETIEYTDATYQQEIERIREKFSPLVEVCKKNGTAIRIGTNHGSLSDRIMSRYGDSPKGMVESAMEFIHICIDLNYHDLILSMKASNPIVMIHAYRLLVAEMKQQGMNYPLHLGVTEAGDGEDGRIKSAVGIGTLLEDGLGDTVRVSLTEPPEAEIPVAKKLIGLLHKINPKENITPIEKEDTLFSPYEYSRKKSFPIKHIGGGQVPVVIADLSTRDELKAASLFPLGYQYSHTLDKYTLTDQAVDWVFTGNLKTNFNWPGALGMIHNKDTENDAKLKFPFFHWGDNLPLEGSFFLFLSDIQLRANQKRILKYTNAILVLHTTQTHRIAALRAALLEWYSIDNPNPVVIYHTLEEKDEETAQLNTASKLGSLITEGLGDGIWISGAPEQTAMINRLAFGILQATRSRISKTEYISCPSCGRTLFDLQETTTKIREATHHLKGIKIGIMGCIVNGPGEMADADYGYVGTGPGKIALYKEKEIIKKGVPEESAVDELVELIKSYGDWQSK